MGTYVTFQAKPGCNDQINAAYRAKIGPHDDWIVYSASVIEQEIAFIHSPAGQTQAHLRHQLHSVADWNRMFYVLREGVGQIKISGIDNEEQREKTRKDIAFLLEHRMLFARIDGLDDAFEYGLTTYKADRIENNQGQPTDRETPITFSDMPKNRSVLYKLCVKYDRPDLWKAFMDFQAAPSGETWIAVRDKIVPWAPAKSSTVWQLVEEDATRRDNRHYGSSGRFQHGKYPSVWAVRFMLTQTAKVPQSTDG